MKYGDEALDPSRAPVVLLFGWAGASFKNLGKILIQIFEPILLANVFVYTIFYKFCTFKYPEDRSTVT